AVSELLLSEQPVELLFNRVQSRVDRSPLFVVILEKYARQGRREDAGDRDSGQQQQQSDPATLGRRRWGAADADCRGRQRGPPQRVADSVHVAVQPVLGGVHPQRAEHDNRAGNEDRVVKLAAPEQMVTETKADGGDTKGPREAKKTQNADGTQSAGCLERRW